MVDGLVLEQKVSHIAGGVTRVEKAKIGLIQFCISPPKTDVGYGLSLSLSFNLCLNCVTLMISLFLSRWRIKSLFLIILKWTVFFAKRSSTSLTFARK